jgi:hypothetical protein
MASNISGVEKCGIKHFRGGQIDISGWTSVASNISGVDKCVASDISGVDKCGIRHFNLIYDPIYLHVHTAIPIHGLINEP